MNVESEPSSLQIKVNDVMNVTHAKLHRLCLSLSKQTHTVYVLCVVFFFFLGAISLYCHLFLPWKL